METDVKDEQRFFESVLENFFNKKELKEFSRKTLSNKVNTSEKGVIGSTEKRQISLEIDDYIEINLQVDLLITFAHSRLDKHKFIELLFLLGRFTITSGKFQTAIYIHEKILSEINEDKTLLSLSASAQLALGEIFSRTAVWALSFEYIKKANSSYNKIHDIKGCANCMNLLGTIHGDRGELGKAVRYFEKGLKLLENTNDDYLQAKIGINLGIVNNISGDYETALSYYKRALLYFEKIKDMNKIAEIRHNMGMLYTRKKDLKNAIKEFDKSISFSVQCGDVSTRGLPYLSKAYIYTLQNDLYLASAFANKALEICSRINDKLSIADIYKINGIIQRKLGSYELAENYLLTSLRLNEELQNKLNQAETSLEIGRLYLETGRADESKKYFNEAIKYYKSIKASNELASIVSELDGNF
ncbi:MAG: tetratricopeptide repeat protein [Ignavibacteriaceae bacterium]